jgi:hypothetical protein
MEDPCKDFNTLSQLIVRESTSLFFQNGRRWTFRAGRHSWNAEHPPAAQLQSIPKGGKRRFAQVYFINKTEQMP